jgi:hypothetical protein
MSLGCVSKTTLEHESAISHSSARLNKRSTYYLTKDSQNQSLMFSIFTSRSPTVLFDEISDSSSNTYQCRGKSEQLGGGTPCVQGGTPDVVLIQIIMKISPDGRK